MATWREQLLPGSFRGVPFHVDSDSSPAGRRTVTHEYPQRDKPMVEDLGRRTIEFKFVAWVAGPNCFEERDALLKVIDEPGPGELVHPWRGRMTVTATECSIAHEHREGGRVRFDLTFVESGELTYPSPTANTSTSVNRAADALQTSAQDRFENTLSGINMGRLQVKSVLSQIDSIRGEVAGFLGPVQDFFRDAQSMYSAIVNGPAAFASMLLGEVNGIVRIFNGFGSAFSGFGSVSLSGIFGKSSAAKRVASISLPASSDAGEFVGATSDLIRDVLISDAMRDVGAIPTIRPPEAPNGTPSIDRVTGGSLAVSVKDAADLSTSLVGGGIRDLPIGEDVRAIREVLSEAMWLAAEGAGPEHYEALNDARNAVTKHLWSVAMQGATLERYTPAIVMPALVLAYRQYGDATRAGELVRRNRVRHPGFLSSEELELIRR